MKELWEEIKKEASQGTIIMDEEEWPISFSTIIRKDGIIKEKYLGEKSFVTLEINNEEEFLSLLEQYVSKELEKKRVIPNFYNEQDHNNKKWIISYLWVNATTEDFKNPENYLRRRISFLEDNTWKEIENEIEIPLGHFFQDSTIGVQKESCPISMETPNRIKIRLKKTVDNQEVSYNLPSIYYGIDKDTCYIYSILEPKQKKELTEAEKQYQKQMNRELYKVTTKVQENQEYLDYKEKKSSYYPEGNITDITHSFLLSLNVFMSLLRKNKIEKIKVVPYLPLRYASRNQMANSQTGERREELLKRNDRIQENATNKLIRLFRRLAYHDKNIEITSLPYELDEYLHIQVDDKQKEIDNMILEEVSNKTIERNLENEQSK